MNTENIEKTDFVVELPGWRLHIAQMTSYHWRDLGNVMDLATKGSIKGLLRDHPEGKLENKQTVGLIRKSLEKIVHETPYPPLCSETLITELLEKKVFPRGCLAWEFLAILTIKSGAPWAVIDKEKIKSPLVFRDGLSGEKAATVYGEISCEGLPVLADQNGIVASPWTEISRYSLEGCTLPLFICFLPREVFRKIQPKTHLGRTVWLTWAYKFLYEKTCSFKEQV